MSEQEKSLEDFARDACARALLGSPYHGSAPGELDAAIGKTALAVAARVREECAQVAQDLATFWARQNNPAAKHRFDACCEVEKEIRAMNEASHG